LAPTIGVACLVAEVTEQRKRFRRGLVARFLVRRPPGAVARNARGP
jgi:hypothetical protein